MRALILFFSIWFFACDAQAIIIQSASRALSYNNVAKYAAPKRVEKNNSVSNSSNNNSVHVVQNKEVDLTTTYSAKVTLSSGDTVAIKVLEDDCCEWKVSYDKVKLTLIGNKISKKERTFTFRQRLEEKSQIALDNIKKENGEYYQNKLVEVIGE